EPVTVRFLRDTLPPKMRLRQVLALQLAHYHRPVRLRLLAPTRLHTADAIEPRLKIRVGHRLRNRPCQPRAREPPQRIANRRRTNPDPLTDYPRRQPCQAQTQNLAHMAHRNPPRRHPFVQSLINRKDGPTIRILHLEYCARSNRNAARDHIGIRTLVSSFHRTARLG